ncbi:MAG: amidase family protein [Pseudomonadota bacterium]
MNRREVARLLAAGTLAAATGCRARPTVNSSDDLIHLDAIAQADLIVAGEVQAQDLVRSAAQRIQTVNPKLNAIIYTDTDRALARARASNGLLGGIPYLNKGLSAYKGMPLTRGSRLFAQTIASDQSAYTDRLDAAGVVVMGQTNTPEFGLLPSTEPLLHGATRNPWNLNHTPGGSSGGAAAAVAARLVPAAHASDGGGSIRIPAAQCGLFGLKPSHGRFPDQGYGDQAWPISIQHAVTISVRDSALLLALTERADNSALLPVGFVQPERVQQLRIALSLNAAEVTPDNDVAQRVAQMANTLESLGHEIIPVEQTPLMDERFDDDFLTLWASGAHAIAQQVTRTTGMPASDSGLLEPFTLGLATWFAEQPANTLRDALDRLRSYQARVRTFLSAYDAWLTPVTASAAPPVGYLAPDVSYDILLPRVRRFAAYTPLHNVAGTPAMSIPAGFSQTGLPIGAQLAAAHGNEALLLALAYQIEATSPWAQQLPPVHG